MQYQYEELQSKWQPIIEHADLPEIGDSHKKSVTAVCLENTEKALREEQGFGPSSLRAFSVFSKQTAVTDFL